MKNTLTTPTVPTVGIELASTSAKRFRDIAILAGFCLVLLFFGLSELPFYSRGEPREGLVVPKGVLHRTRAPERAVILMVETAAIVPTGDA